MYPFDDTSYASLRAVHAGDDDTTIGFDDVAPEPCAAEPYVDDADTNPHFVWVLCDAERTPANAHDYASEDELKRRFRAHARPPRWPERSAPPQGAWYALERAADLLGEDSPDALRKKLTRAARRGADGVVYAEIDGITARKMGKLWKVRLSPEWLAIAPKTRWGRP